MKRFLLPILILLFATSMVNCERDDICDGNTPTTPRLIIDFINVSGEQNVLQKLEIREQTIDSVMTFTNVSQIEVPLRTNADNVVYSFRLTYGGTVDPQYSTDLIEFNYTRENKYVSRACGYKTVFALNTTNPLVFNGNPSNPNGNWVNSYFIDTYTIETENETHITIIF